jgi:glycerophosphoryl diester phosphodiesterase
MLEVNSLKRRDTISTMIIVWKIHPHPYIRNDARPIVFAHRGDRAQIPENTLQAFEDAYRTYI